MAKATLILTDIELPNGEMGLQLQTQYEGDAGFDPESGAHQHALLLVKHMGTIAERRGETQVDGNAIDPLNPFSDSSMAAAALASEMDKPEIPAVPIPATHDASPARGLIGRLETMRSDADAAVAANTH